MAEGGNKLSEEQIYECLKSLNVPVRMNDLKVPSREFIVRVFECFLKDLQIDIASHELRTWEATNHFEGDIYEEPMLLLLLAMSVNHITDPCGLHITMKDIIEPKPKRTKKILNYLLVFWNYYLRKYARFRAIEEIHAEEKQKIQDFITENESLDEKYNDMLNVMKNMQPSKQELVDLVAVKEEKALKLKMQSEAAKSGYEALKTKEASIRNEIGAIDVRIVTAKERIVELGQLVLSSPERINAEIQQLQDRIKTEDMKIKELEKRCKDAEKLFQLQEESQGEEEKDNNVLNDLNGEVKHLRDTVKTIVAVYEKMGEEEDKVKRLQMDVDRKEEWKLQGEQKSAKVVLNSKKQIETLSEVLKMNLNEEARKKKDVELIKAAIHNLQGDIDSESDNVLEIIRKCKDADARSKEMKSQYFVEMKDARNSFKSDCEEVVGGIKKTFPFECEKNSNDTLE